MNKYLQILESDGQEKASQYMKQVRSHVTNHPGGSFKNKKFARQAQLLSAKKRQQNRETRQSWCLIFAVYPYTG